MERRKFTREFKLEERHFGVWNTPSRLRENQKDLPAQLLVILAGHHADRS
jgi:hypothetical protein